MLIRSFFCFTFIAILSFSAKASDIKGKVSDSASGEVLIGATIVINETRTGVASGLDGSFTLRNIPSGKYTISCSYLGYQTIEQTVIINKNEVRNLDFSLHSVTNSISQIVVTAQSQKNTDIGARNMEKTSAQVLNIVSAKSIEISPDITVANVIQRVSGVTIERNASGDGQYALLRGMDKRFNYTMVNGVKIPSPDNKNRFVPLDIFPSELLDRLEVNKSLTANMEGDGIGGSVNMVMKDAPSKVQFTANLGTGYNSLFLSNNERSFDAGAISRMSPNEKYGTSYPVQIKDFTTKNLHLLSGTSLPNLSGGISYGNRFFGGKMGIIIAGSYQNNMRGNSSDVYGTSLNISGKQDITDRFYSNRQTRWGIHFKADYRLSEAHKLVWYNTYMDFTNMQVREARSYNSQTTRLRWNHQNIMNSTLKGFHSFIDTKLNIDWTVSIGRATNETPDNVQINELIINETISPDQNTGATRRWEHNSDRDLTGSLNIRYLLVNKSETTFEVSAGGLYRDKYRMSFFNEYILKPYDPSKDNPRELIRGIDYSNFDGIRFSVNNYGNISDPLNYNASEKVASEYVQGILSAKKIEVNAGVRIENTEQGYFLKFPTEGARNEGSQNYNDLLPSLGIKYLIRRNTALRVSYYRAINRPSFFEIVPYSIIYEDYKEHGNPDLKHTIADNFDLRYEYFPTPSEQLMAGFFYKKIMNPIEFGMMNGFGQDTYYMPMNFGDADNYGFETDIIKYFNWLGIKANYTFTNSDITTTKMKVIPNPDPNAETNIITKYVSQKRPLFGQAAHVLNFSLLLKDKKQGWDGQISFSYTSDRIVIVSRYLNEDSWQAGYITLDTSVEKRFVSGLTVFLKASNLLNTPMIQYIKENDSNISYKGLERYNGGIVERKEYYGINFSIGLRFKLI